MADCYALNVSDAAVWVYYYADFPLVRIGSDGQARAWRTTVGGANAFATDDHHVLFFSGYGSQRGQCLLGHVQGDVVEGMVTCQLIFPSGEPLTEGYVIGRGQWLHVFSGNNWYGLDLPSVLR